MVRRTFIDNLSKTLVLFFLPFLGCNNTSSPNQFRFLESHLSRIFSKEIILKIGKEYQELFPSETNEIQLNQLLFENNFINQELSKSNEIFTEQSIKDDFARNNIVLIDGWFLSRNEARLCALFEILNR